MDEKVSITGDPNEMQIITIAFEGEELFKLKAYQKMMQNVLDEVGNPEDIELSLGLVIKSIVVRELDEVLVVENK